MNTNTFKGGLIANSSVINVDGNTFKNMKCTNCSGLIMSIIKSSKTQIKNNLFESNIAREATCAYITENHIYY